MSTPILLEEAFEKVIFTRGIYNKLGIPEGTVSSLRTQYKKKSVSAKKMREILVLAGYKLVQQETWESSTEND